MSIELDPDFAAMSDDEKLLVVMLAMRLRTQARLDAARLRGEAPMPSDPPIEPAPVV